MKIGGLSHPAAVKCTGNSSDGFWPLLRALRM